MKNIGITGQHGFVGYHLYQTINLFRGEFKLIDFNRCFFEYEEKLDSFVKDCDVIVHLAAINRHSDAEAIYDTNITLIKKLVASLERTKSQSHVIMSSSTQEARDNLYGKSKKEGRLIFSEWANRVGGKFTGMVIPNVFGPFGHAYYNSVVATFCYQVSHNEIPNVNVDGQLQLIYVADLVEEILNAIRTGNNTHEYQILHTAEAKVSEILTLLQHYKEVYQEKGEFPAINSPFEHKLFNTFRCYMDIENYFPRKFTQHLDHRGAFVEVARLGIPGQVSFSTTVAGVKRGNHFHTRKIERFAIIKGKALIQLRRIGSDEVLNFYLDGAEPAYVDIPIWYTHNIENIGTEDLYSIFWINEPFDSQDADTYFEVV